MMMRLLCCALLALSCSAGALDESVAEPVSRVAATEAGLPPSCEVVFSPDADLLDDAVDAARQWSEATGCNIRVGDDGIPVSLVARVLNAKGEPQCGVTRRLRNEAGAVVGVAGIDISASRADRCWQTERHLLHEMGHALAPHRGHAVAGLMAPVPDGTDYVDALAVELVSAELLASH